jgi:hypothetical protein
LFGFADQVGLAVFGWKMNMGEFAYKFNEGIYAIQTTTNSNMAARRKKILAEPNAKAWCAAGGRILLIGWSKKGERGKVKRWTPTIEEVRP